MIKPGIYKDLSLEQYHADKNSLSRSSLLDFDKSAYYYWSQHLNEKRPIKEKTNSQLLGSAFHCMILEPDTFSQHYIIAPEPVKLKDVGRERYDAYKENLAECEATFKHVISWEMYCEMQNMRDVFNDNRVACELLIGSNIEYSLFWEDLHSGLLLKARPDAYHENVILDLKTTSDASPRAFQNSMILGGYHIQGAMIQDALEQITGTRINRVINIVIETKYPYQMGIYMIDEFALEEGKRKYKQLCLDLKQCLSENKWLDYGIKEIGLPKWAMI